MIRQLFKNKKAVNISGRVVKGKQYGRVLGFPTANLDRRDFSRRKLKIKLGVYAGLAEIISPLPRIKYGAGSNPPHKGEGNNKKFLPLEGGGKVGVYKAGIIIGPIDKTGLPKIEAHLIGFKGDLYGIYVCIYLYKYIRPFKKFSSEAELKQQIRKDIQRVRKLVI